MYVLLVCALTACRGLVLSPHSVRRLRFETDCKCSSVQRSSVHHMEANARSACIEASCGHQPHTQLKAQSCGGTVAVTLRFLREYYQSIPLDLEKLANFSLSQHRRFMHALSMAEIVSSRRRAWAPGITRSSTCISHDFTMPLHAPKCIVLPNLRSFRAAVAGAVSSPPRL